MTITIVV